VSQSNAADQAGAESRSPRPLSPRRLGVARGQIARNAAVYRTSTAQYFIFGSETGFTAPILFGAPGLGDIPLNRRAAPALTGRTAIAVSEETIPTGGRRSHGASQLLNALRASEMAPHVPGSSIWGARHTPGPTPSVAAFLAFADPPRRLSAPIAPRPAVRASVRAARRGCSRAGRDALIHARPGRADPRQSHAPGDQRGLGDRQ
jgi:hypothetical protein